MITNDEWCEWLAAVPSVPIAIARGPAFTAVAICAQGETREVLPAVTAMIASLAECDEAVMIAPSLIKVIGSDDDKREHDATYEHGQVQREHEAGDMSVLHVSTVTEMRTMLHASTLTLFERSIADDGGYTFTLTAELATSFESYVVDRFWELYDQRPVIDGEALQHRATVVAALIGGMLAVSPDGRLEMVEIAEALYAMVDFSGGVQER